MLVGQQLSETYRIVRQIAHGGMGAIYEAVHLRLGGKRYAIKVLASRYASNPDAVARFRREALITSGLRNEHIVEVHDFNVDGGLAYLVMELLVGEDLASRLKRARSLPMDAVTRVLAQVVVALDAAHRARIVHRDLKPQNIFLCARDGRDDYVKVLDFGVSKLLDSSTMLTAEYALLGTPFYMAPEQAQGDPRTSTAAPTCSPWEPSCGSCSPAGWRSPRRRSRGRSTRSAWSTRRMSTRCDPTSRRRCRWSSGVRWPRTPPTGRPMS